jgi:hypothetical protein
MDEILLLMALLFVAYLFLPKSWSAKFAFKSKSDIAAGSPKSKNRALLPEDSVLRRHYITQLRKEIEQDLFPRPSESTLQRHYDALVNSELENRLATLSA